MKTLDDMPASYTYIDQNFPTYTDYFGCPLRRGDLITYPVRSGSMMWLSVAKIVDIAKHGVLKVLVLVNDGWGDSKDFHLTKSTVSELHRVVKINQLSPQWKELHDHFIELEGAVRI